MTVPVSMLETSRPFVAMTAQSGCWNGYGLPGATEFLIITTRLPIATAKCNAPVSPPRMRKKVSSAPGYEQWHSGGNREAGLVDRFQRGAFGRATPKKDLDSVRTPVSGDRNIIFQRPVFLG